jgi:uncharacterized OB-fold protein
MWCIYCGHEWVGKSMYCPKCGLSAEVEQAARKKTRPEFMAAVIVMSAATAVIFWLAGKG